MHKRCELLFHFIRLLMKLITPGGKKALIAENLALKQQLITLNRNRLRSPALTTFDRTFFGFLAQLISPNRIKKIAVILKPANILKFHQALVKRKYRLLYSQKSSNRTGRKPLDQSIIDFIVEFKQRNPNVGYGRIAMQIYQAFGISISRFAVGRILRKKHKSFPKGRGPSWLTFLGHMKDSLWSVDLFRCESIGLRFHCVMVVIDQFSRRIIGFAVHTGDPDGKAVCRMFNEICSDQSLPNYLSLDNDPLFTFHQWQANLRIMEIEEIKSVPKIPISHPFVERVIGTCRHEFLDQVLFWNANDLQSKLNQFQEYYNGTRAHSSIDSKTPFQKAGSSELPPSELSLQRPLWKSQCRGLFCTPLAA